MMTFNSLSRDHGYEELYLSFRGKPIFQLPLSGSHLSSPSIFSVFLTSTLSTPSLGITEPYSGIFRLSAAFCRGTSSHK